MPIVLGLGTPVKDPLGLYGGGGLEPDRTESRIEPVDTTTDTQKPLADLPQKVVTQSSSFDENDWNDIVNTVIAEAGGEGEQGMAAVAAVIKNRAANRGVSPGAVVRQPKQFEGYENPREESRKAQQDPEMRRRAEQIVLGVFDGAVPDPTGGADHFHADYVDPDWAKTMPRTTKIGGHSFYASKQREAAAKPSANQIVMAEGFEIKDPMGFYGGSSKPADTVIEPERLGAAQEGRVPGNPEAKGLARLMPPEKEIDAGAGGVLHFRHKGQDKIDQSFKSVLVDTSKAMGRNFEITSGFRSPQHPVERRKKSPGEHARGTASDINMKGMSDQERMQLVTELRARGVKRFGTYTDSPDMLHVDMKDQAGNGSTWFMHDRTNRRLGKAPEWFRNVASGKAPEPIEGRAQLAVDTEFQTKDPMGIYRDGDPFQQEAQRGAAEEQAAAAAAEQEAQRAAVDAENSQVEAAGQNLDADNPGRYRVLDESDLAAWKEQWEADNRSGGVMGDTGRILKSGTASVVKSLSAIGDVIANVLPGDLGKRFLDGSDAIDEWLIGKPLEQKVTDFQDRANASVTPRQAEADDKSWWDSENSRLGPAWTDPRSYLRGVGESLPGSVLTMGPSAALARGAFTRALGAGMGQRAAAAAASRTALLSGSIGEGILGGGQSAMAVKERIAALPREQLVATDTIRTMVAEGMSEDEAISALTGDAATQAFVISGVATGLFGGMGDRALAKILAEGVGGNIAKRVLAGAARGAVGEGVLEELPQSAAQAVSENLAVRTADPNQSLTEGVAEAAAGGLAAGGAMGGALGGAGGAASRANTVPGDIEPDVEPEQIVAPPERRGPLTSALEHGEQQAIRQQQESIQRSALERAATAASPETSGMRPEVGATVRVQAEGVEPFLARIDGYDGNDVLVIDGSTGEVYQVPIGSIEQTAPAVTPDSVRDFKAKYPTSEQDSIPDFSKDDALRPLDPIAGETTSEIPPEKEQGPALERLSGRPSVGQRVIVDDPTGGQFVARVDGYEGDEVLVTDGNSGQVYQVPADRLYVSKLTPKEVEAQELERNPPVERETPELKGSSRRLGDKTVEMPDELHARIYDLGKERLTSKRLMGTSMVRMDDGGQFPSLTWEQRTLAKELGVDPQAMGQMADDYRYRVERAAKQAKSKLPVKMHGLNKDRLKGWQGEHRRAGALDDIPEPVEEAGQWWDGLPPEARRAVLDKAGVKRSEKKEWKDHSTAIRAKLAPFQTEDAAPGIDAAAHVAATSPHNDLPEPTEAQKEAGNYKVGRVSLGGMDMSIENPAGSERKGTSSSGKAWSVKMKSHYGYIRGTVGRDKDHIDVFVKPGTAEIDGAAKVYVVDQRDPARGRFDEHKVMVGYSSEEEATAAYMENYTAGWKGLGAITETDLDGFKSWLKSGKTSEPFAPKWFGSREKAEAYIEKEKLGDTHGIGGSGKRFEVREKKDLFAAIYKEMADRVSPTEFARRVAASKNSQESAIIEPGGKLLVIKATSNPFGEHAEFFQRLSEAEMVPSERAGFVRVTSFANQVGADAIGPIPDAAAATLQALKTALAREGITYTGEAADVPAARTEKAPERRKPAQNMRENMQTSDDVTSAQVREVMRSKEFKAAYAEIAASQMGTPRPESPVAYDLVRGWLDQKAGRPPEYQKVPSHSATGHDPIEPYYMGYAAARDGKARVIRASYQDEAYADLTEPRPEPPPQQQPAARKSERPKTAAKEKLPVTKNTVFTDDAAEKARALLRKKLSGSTLNSGIDPEILQAGITLAGYHIEKGARTFAAYAGAMLADLGDDVRPYLKSWYMGVKYDPRATAFDGLSSAAEVEAADVDGISAAEGTEADVSAELDQPGPGALERASSEQVPRAETGRESGAGVEGRSGTDLPGGGRTRTERRQTGRGVADGQGDLLAAASGSDRDSVAPKISESLVDVKSAAVPAQQRPSNYVITASDAIGEGGSKAKFRGNIAAIQLLRQLEAENRAATVAEQSVLAKWVGWGGLRSAFFREGGDVTKGWEKEAAELKALLTPEEYSAAESSTRNAHYTSPEVVSAVWEIARRLGFRGGKVLEPSVGSGNFLGMMPGEVRDGASITGVELDRITGGIAKNLYPGANIQTPVGFEKLTVPDDYFDLAIGNPPFGSERLYDKQRRHLNKMSIHNFFFAKSIEALRPGGVLAMVVTNRFLDGNNSAARDHIAKSADLVGAIRLPNNAFLKNAGTEVTTDIVLLRKRMEGDKPDTGWTSVGEWKGADGKKVPLNRYFIDNPEMMLGDFGAYGTMYGPDDPALVARDGEALPELLDKAVAALPENIMVEPGAGVTETVTLPETVTDVQVGTAFLAPDGSVHVRKPDHIGQPRSEAVEFPNETAKARVQGMVRIRDAFAKLRRAQIDEKASDDKIENLRKRLNTVYDGFVGKHGPVNGDANKRLFRDDPTWPQISALEQDFDKGLSSSVAKRTGETAREPSAKKSAIFSKRTQQPYSPVTSAKSAKDALAAVLNEYGRVNIDAMADLYGRPAEVIIEELGPLLYKTPAGAYETADAYLSGNVKQKLAEAERAAETDTDFRRNVAALRDVQPADIEAVDIDVKPGAPWVPAKHIEAFITHISESSAKPSVFYSRANAKWAIEVPRASPAAQTLYGTDRATVSTVLGAVLNGQSITIYDRLSDGKTEVNQPATEAANEKAARVKAEWGRWIWQDDARRTELARLYNDTFNTDVLRVYDGSHLTLPGKVGDDIIELRPHQKAWVWRRLQGGTALADHTVGAGKTFAEIAATMEKRRTGQARKPMLVVPNHLVGQWAADFIKLYPGAKVLAATKRDFEQDNRKRLFARIATGDWDAVIVAHSSFGRIGINPEYEARFIQQQMDDLEASIAELRQETGQKSRNVAQLTKWRDNLKSKMERLLDAGKKDDGLTFDELGVDAITVDEAHEFKNLAYSTSMQRVAGLGNSAGSQRAADLYMKTQFILEQTGGNNVTFLTGTPLSNTMAEMYTVQRYLDRNSLTDLGIAHFDAWAKVFGEVVTDWELSPSGQYKLNSRFAKFVNVPELMQRYRSFADVITNDDIKAQMAAMGRKMPLPKVKGGKPTIVVVDRSPDQAAYIGEGTADTNGNLVYPSGSIVYRAENLPKKAEKGADNMLKVMSDARKAALDMRLVDSGYGDFAGSKVHRAADEMTRIYKKWAAKRGTQLVFIDLSTPKKAMATEQAKLRELIAAADAGVESAQEALDKMSPDDFLALQGTFSVYDDLKQKLLDRGIPEGEIAFIHDANTEAQKEELFGKVRSGRIRFLFGSTAKMGAGTNVQNRLVGLHHLDAPWRPSDLEQRDGRGIRQGNELYAEDPDGFEIEIMRYATENTLDARQWQTIEAKAKFIEQIRKGDMKTRDIEDIGGEAANAAEMKAAASGNPMILEEMETRRRLQTLERQSTEHDREQHRIKSRVRALTEEAERLEARMPDTEADAARAAAVEGKPFAGTISGQTFDKHKEFGAALIAAIRKDLIEKAGETEIGSYAGFNIAIEHQHDRRYSIMLSGSRDYFVDVQDAADMEPTGTAMRIVNTIKRLASVPDADRTRIGEIETQIPALEKQLAPWSGQTDLDETVQKHRRLVDALKPKPKAAAGQTVEVKDGPVAEVTPKPDKPADAVTVGADGRLKSAGQPVLNKTIPLRDAAVARVTEDGKRTGHEYLLAIDDDGTIVEYGTAGSHNSTGMNNGLLSAMANKDRKIVVFHNHPSNSAVSRADVAFLAFPGLQAIWAAGHGGRVTRASLTTGGGWMLKRRNIEDIAASQKKLSEMIVSVEEVIRPFLQNMVDVRILTPDQAQSAHNDAWLETLDRANIIDYSTNMPYNLASIEGLDALINATATKLAGEYFNDKRATIRRADRRTQPLRHVAELADAPVGSQPDAAAGPTQTGPAETSPADYKREGRGGKGRRVTENRVVEEIGSRLTDLQPAVLKAIPLNYFTELARPNMTAVGDYLRVKRSLDAYRGKKHSEADAIAQDWLKFVRLGLLGKDKTRAEQLSGLMHDTTLAGIDPSLTDDETKAKAGYQELRKRYQALPPAGKALYNRARDAYKDQAEELDKILLDNVRKAQQIALDRAEARHKKEIERIERSLKGRDRSLALDDADKAYTAERTKAQWTMKARMTKMRIAFESSRVEAPYFPLGRFGRYFVSVKDVNGEVLHFSKHETARDRDQTARQMQKGYPTATVQAGVMENGNELRDAMDPRVLAEIDTILGEANVSDTVMDQIWQRYLETMPDLSARKRFIHRKGTAGFSSDALRVFSSHMFHAAHQMGRLKYGLELQELVNNAKDQAKESDDQTRGMTLANELAKRHDWVMNPTGSKAAQVMTSAAFVWYLAASPASALVNMTQTLMLGLPILGARYGGVVQAASAIASASRDSVSGKGRVSKADLKPDERRAMDAFYESGLIDRTQSHDIAGVGETGVEYSPLRTKVMSTISWAFHNAEVWNREVTALAAYRLARKSGQSETDAIDAAHEMTWKTHFDYSNSSRPALLQNDLAKVAMVFRAHNINMLYRVSRDIHQATKGESAQIRKEARYQLAGVFGMMSLMAGVTGTMGFNLAMAIAGMLFGDDDDPMDFEQTFRKSALDILGPELGGIVLNGAPGHYLGIDLSSRIGMPDLWFRSPSRELQGRDEYQYWVSQTLGATFGLGESLYSGFSIMTDEGKIARGLEVMAPKAVRDLLKAYRYSAEGVTSIRGDEILPADDVDVSDIIAQAIGFTPAKVSETWDRNTALKNAEKRILNKRRTLINSFATAVGMKDAEARNEAIQRIKAFNAVPINRPLAIKADTLKQSLKTRARNAAKREDGALIANPALGKKLRDRLSDPIYR